MATREYETDEIVVHWDSRRCIHTGICLRALPEVFDVATRPWVRVDNAAANEVIKAVEQCPTGALRYRRKAGPAETAPPETTIIPVPNGPLVLRGRLRVVGGGEGGTVTEEARLCLCRCGASRNQPFCDNSHRRVRFESRAASSEAARDAAANPAEVCAPQTESFSRR